jgi:hypothetical protein
MSTLFNASMQLDGGVRSFPTTQDAAIQRDFGYHAPNVDYERLFHFQAARSSQTTPKRSSGWLIPDERSQCHPVFIANSLLSAIGLVRDMLPRHTLGEDGWQRLVHAAQALAVDVEAVPPSAQNAGVIPSSDEEPSSLPLARKRKLPPTLASPGSSWRRPSAPPVGSRQEESPEPSSPLLQSPKSPPAYVTTVTNHNHRAEQKRASRQEKAAARKRISIGLRKPTDTASVEEKTSYSTIAPADEAEIAWVIKQPVGQDSDFYTMTSSPYKTACSLLASARAVGSQHTWHNAAIFLRSWRERGTPVPTRTSATEGTMSTQIAHLPSSTNSPSITNGCDADFERAWHVSNYCEQRLAAAVIEHRWAMALLGRAYAAKIKQLQDENTGTPLPPLKTKAINSLLHLVCPHALPQERKVLVRRLTCATRWYSATETLGWGSLCLMPPDNRFNRWVEKEVLAYEWPIWLQLVKRVSPEAHAASQTLDRWLGVQAIQGGPIQSDSRLFIEEKGPSVVYEVEEITDSTDEESDSSVEDTTRIPKGSIRRFRQLSLLELFKPQ